MNLILSDFLGIKTAFFQILYNIFVKGPLYIVHGLGDAITYLSGQKIVDKIFGTNGHFLNMPPQFLIFLAIAIMLIVLFAGGVILRAMVHQNIRSEIAGIANRSIIVILLILLIPLFFWVINFTVISIIHIIMPEFIHGEKLANMVGALGFTDGLNHKDWHYDVGYPDMENYNLFLGTLGSFFCMIIFFYLGLSLIQRIFDLFLYFKKYYKNVFKQLINVINLFKKFYDNPKKYDKKFIYNFDNQHDIDINNYLKSEGYSTINNSLIKEIGEKRIKNMIYEKKYAFQNWPLVVKIIKTDDQEVVISPELFYFLLDDVTKDEINQFKFIKNELPPISTEKFKGRQYIYVLEIKEEEIAFSNEKQISTFFKILLKSDNYNFFFDFENLKKIINQLIFY